MLRLTGALTRLLSIPPRPLLKRVEPAPPFQTPFSPGSGPSSTCPSGPCGVGREGARLPPLPLPLPNWPCWPGFCPGGTGMIPCPTPWSPLPCPAGFCPKEGAANEKITAAVATAAKPSISRFRTSTLLNKLSLHFAPETELWDGAFAGCGAQLLPGGGQRHRSRVAVLSAILGQGSADDDLIAFLHGVLLPPAALQQPGRTHLEGPVSGLAAL